MVDMERGARFAPVAEFGWRRALQVGVASSLADWHAGRSVHCGCTHDPDPDPFAHDGIRRLFVPGVGQYEVITGIAAGERIRRSPDVRWTAAYGASRPLPRVAATVCFLIAERALSLGGRNWSSCP
jgi:hypothetical protein